MKKKWSKSVIISLVAIFLIFGLTMNVLGANGLIDIQAYLNTGINVMLQGQKFEPKEADGTNIIPITYKGRTYLPLRAVAEAVGLEVTWDANTNTAYLGEVGGEIAKDTITWTRVTPEFGSAGDRYRLKSRTPEHLSRAPGKTFEFGYAYDLDSSSGISIDINTNFEYDKFKTTLWVDSEKMEDGQYDYWPAYVSFEDEHGSPVYSLEVEYGNLYEVEFDIKDVQRLDIHVHGSLSVIGEPMLGK